MGIFPNPVSRSSNEVYVTNTTQQSSFYLFDMKGILVDRPDADFDKINGTSKLKFTEEFTPGVYILKVDQYTYKLIIKN